MYGPINPNGFWLESPSQVEVHFPHAPKPYLWINNIRQHQSHPPPLPADALDYQVSLPENAIQWFKEHGFLWLKQRMPYGKEPLENAEKWMAARRIAFDAQRYTIVNQNPINKAAEHIVKALYGGARVAVEFSSIGPVLRKPIVDKTPYVTRAHTDTLSSGPANVKEWLQNGGVKVSSVVATSEEVLNVHRLLCRSTQDPLIIMSHKTLEQNRYKPTFPPEVAAHHANDEWFYLPGADPDDVLIFKQWSEDDQAIVVCPTAPYRTPTIRPS